jgi:hypothetical protein
MSKRVEVLTERVEPKLFRRATQGGALLLMALVMIACSKEPSAPPAPMTTAPPVETPPAKAGGPDTSVPDAGSVLTPSAGPKADPTAGRTNGAMTPSQESSAMPMSGQNNDHSAPVGPAKRASSPSLQP